MVLTSVYTFYQAAGASASVQFEALADVELSTWDEHIHAWAKAKGKFNVMVGASSRDIRATAKLDTRH